MVILAPPRWSAERPCHDGAMPSFCRHNRLLQNCPICTREQSIEGRPVVSSGAPPSARSRPASSTAVRAREGRDAARGARAGSRGGLKVRRLVRGADDGHRAQLAPGLRSSAEAERLALELSLSSARLELLASRPPGVLAEIADPDGDLEERTWLAFQVAYIGPSESQDPFASISAARASWSSGEPPHLQGVQAGPRGAHDPSRGARTVEAYRAWASRAGSQAAAFGGEPTWTPERRFARVYERLALPGLTRDARFELLVLLGHLRLYDLRPATLALGGDNLVTIAAKRAFGIGDPLLLGRRALALAGACELPLEALDLALFNWESRERTGGGVSVPEDDAAGALPRTRAALGLSAQQTGASEDR